MWPWGHLAVGYLLYSAYAHHQFDQTPRGLAVIVLAVGTQFPDAIDKPLAWTFAILPSGRSLAHSLFAAAAVIAVVAALAKAYDDGRGGRLVVPFGLGYLSHLAADGVYPVSVGAYADLSYLLWPVVAVGPDASPSFLAHFMNMELTTFSMIQLGLVLVALVVWVRDGTPGSDLRAIVPSRHRRAE